MKLKVLFLFLSLSTYMLEAQQPIRTLIISEARFDQAYECYVELTNVGLTTLHLKEFEFGTVHPWNSRIDVNNINKWFYNDYMGYFMLPDWTLDPGKSIVIASVNDYNPKMWLKDQDRWQQAITKPEMWKLADIQIHLPESTIQPAVGDSVTPYYDVMDTWQGRECWYVRHHYAPGDSEVVDQVGGVFTDTNGQQAWNGKDVAGVSNATENSILVRKFSVTQGNIDFNTGRGTNAAESEWMVLPILVPGGFEPNRAVFWTVGNHENCTLDAAHLNSSSVDINWSEHTLTVPWGVRRDDSIMGRFSRTAGLAWHYDYIQNKADSAFESVRTGDILTMYACGNNLQKISFTITLVPPAVNANIVIPKRIPNHQGSYLNAGDLYEVTDNVPVIDTIRASILYGIPFATRVDTLLKYLEKAPNAGWQIEFVDGLERTDLRNGDKLVVTAENSAVRHYYIKVDQYRPSHDAALASITWPDIPSNYRNAFGWTGDTIPGFSSDKLEYFIKLPPGLTSVPAFQAKSENLNGKIYINRAISLEGALDDRTISFTSTSEDYSKQLVYKVHLQKGESPENTQPWAGEPFISQFCFRQDYINDFMEIVNPGNQPLDLSHYMLTFCYAQTPAQAITFAATASVDDWNNRYAKYIPGMKWQSQQDWSVKPAIATQDLNVNPIVLPGDVFVLADMRSYISPANGGTAATFLIPQIDIDFAHNPWGETLNQGQALDQSWAVMRKEILFKILNDSVYHGLKPATSPNDFQVVDMFGFEDNGSSYWVIGGIFADQVTNWTRKPFIYKGNPVISSGVFPGGSFGTDENNSEWIMINESRLQNPPYSLPWPDYRIHVPDGIGSHFMNEVTAYKSTISSKVYKVTPGYSMHEGIRGIIPGTKISDFKLNILKADEAQLLFVKSHINGALLSDSMNVTNGDSLLVRSADSKNTSLYIISLSALNDDAVLISQNFAITIIGNSGTVNGMNYDTKIRTVLEGIKVPAGATLNVLDLNGSNVPLRMRNIDNVYEDVSVNDNILFEVIAEDGVTKILYQLKPNSKSSDAFVFSNILPIDQANSLIRNLPPGTSVSGLLNMLIPAYGATVKVIDKFGFERSTGIVVSDDKVVVTAEDELTEKVYYFGSYLTPPEGLTGIAGNKQVSLRWNPSSGADFARYKIYMGTSANQLNLQDSTVLFNIYDTTRTISGLTNGVNYYFSISATNIAGVSTTPGNIISLKPMVDSSARLTVGNVTGYIGKNLSIPVNAEKILDITGFHFTISYDTTKLSYVNCSNWSGGTNPSAVIITSSPGEISFEYNDAPVNLAKAKFFDLNFNVIAHDVGIASIGWNEIQTPAEITNSTMEVIPCTYSSGFVTILYGNTLSGELSYDNSINSKLNNVQLELRNYADILLSTITTDQLGNFSFPGLIDGEYSLKPLLLKPWGGVTSMDLTLYKKYIGGLLSMTPLRLKSGDVNMDGKLSTLDLTFIKQRIGARISTFNSGDYADENTNVSIYGADKNIKLKVICYGDANGSYMPAVNKKSMDEIFIPGSEKLIASRTGNFEIPLRVNNSAYALSSVTLSFNYPSDWLDIEDIQMVANNEDLYYTIEDGIIRIVYSTLQPIDLEAGDTLMTIFCKLRDKSFSEKLTGNQQLFSGSGEFGDFNDKLLSEVHLIKPQLNFDATTVKTINSDVRIYPNPAKDKLMLENAENTQLIVFNILGKQMILKKCNSVYEQLDISKLPVGTYLIKIIKGDQAIVKKFVVAEK